MVAQFTGDASHVRGPASCLKCYFNRLCWSFDSSGFIRVSAFHQVHLLHSSLSRLAQCLMLAWQQDLVKTYTLRTKLFSYPDVSRADTCQVPKKFADVNRKNLLQQKAAAFRGSMQMQHWIQTQDGACPYYPEQDSAWHRIIECPAFASCIQPF